MTTTDKLRTVREVADILGVSRATVYRFIDSGDLTAINVGTTPEAPRLRVRTTDLDRFIAARIPTPTTAQESS